jgi:hypothetical protein
VSIRTDADEVAALFPGVTFASGVLDAFIADASLWIDNYLVGACVSLPDDKLPTIEKYIAAHLYQLSVEGAGGQLIGAARADINERYAERKGDDAGSTTFIRTATAYDPCGIIARFWLGKKRMIAYVGAGYDSRHTGGPA